MTARRCLTLALLLFTAFWSTAGPRAAHRPGPSFRAAHPTIEPTLPFGIDLRLEGIERGPSESRASLIVVVRADRSLHDIELTMPAPSEGALFDTQELPVRPIELAAGESRTFTIPVRGPGRRDLSLRLAASFRTEDGRTLRVGQGVTLKADAAPEGRSQLGAWEVMAVPLEALHP
jgi:hypothetical protein